MAKEWIFVEIFVNIMEQCTMFYLLCHKFSPKYRTVFLTLSFILLNVVYSSLPLFLPSINFPSVEIVTLTIIFIYVLLFRIGNIFRKIFWVVLVGALLSAIAFISIMTVSFVSKVSGLNIIMERTELSVVRLQVIVMARIIHLMVFYILARTKKRNENLWNWSLTICFGIPLITFLLAIIIYEILVTEVNYSIPDLLIYVIALGFLLLNIIVFILYELINKEAEKNYNLMAKHKQYDNVEQHNNEIIGIYSDIRKWQHDYKNHMQLITVLLEESEIKNSNIEQAIHYIQTLDEKIQTSTFMVSTGNYVVDAIITAKSVLASSFNMELEYNISLTQDISMSDVDLCAVLSNLLDNAIEACCKLDDRRYINLDMMTVKNQLHIQITNSTDGKYIIENGEFRTTKQSHWHGIGIQQIKSIVEEYKGIYGIEAKEDSFSIQISIPIVKNNNILS